MLDFVIFGLDQFVFCVSLSQNIAEYLEHCLTLTKV